MKYITQVDNLHVVEVNGHNVKVKKEVDRWSFYGMSMDKYYRIDCAGTPLATIVLFCELVKLIEEHI